MAPSLVTEAVKPIFHFGGGGVHIFCDCGEVHVHGERIQDFSGCATYFFCVFIVLGNLPIQARLA